MPYHRKSSATRIRPLLLALIPAALVGWPALLTALQPAPGAPDLSIGKANATVHFRTAPFASGQEIAGHAELLFGMVPPLA